MHRTRWYAAQACAWAAARLARPTIPDTANQRPVMAMRAARFTLQDRWLALTEALALDTLHRAHRGEAPGALLCELVANAVTDANEE